MRRIELPASLGRVFTIAEAKDAGVSRSRLRAADLTVAHRGLRIRAGNEPISDGFDWLYERQRKALVERARVLARVMPEGQFFTDAVAAAIWNLPIPTALLDPELPLHVGVLAPVRHARRQGVVGHQLQPHLVGVTVEDGLRVTDPASTWVRLATVLHSDIELIAAGDGVVRERIFRSDREPIATLEDLEAKLAAGRHAGITRLRRVLGDVRTRSASAGETRCRILVLDSRLPEPELNFGVLRPSGGLVAVVDLAYPDLKIAIEYEGDQHRTDTEQWGRDIARHEELVAMGWIVIRVTKEQLYRGPREVAERVRRAVAARSTVA